MGIIKEAFWKISGEQIELKKCTSYYFYCAKVQKKNGYPVPFSNYEHVENDECIPEWGATVYEYIGRTGNKALVDYFAKMIAMYPS